MPQQVSLWRCQGRRPDPRGGEDSPCRAVLGRVVDGELTLFVTSSRGGRDALWRVSCPSCGAERTWMPRVHGEVR